MGKGDKKTRRGKIIMGTYGRLRRRKKSTAITATTKPKTAAKIEPTPKTEATPKAESKPKAKPAAKKTTKKKTDEESE
ncbi:30S ribosomal protein THX [Aquimarina sp. AU58]|uniref:30S ribosomal protein THX n=1 Tax=Aquimarina sp. AU58 TaxID=1874112 RepID=UPI000D6586B0